MSTIHFYIILFFQLTSSQGGWLDTLTLVSKLLPFQLTSSQGGWRSPRGFLASIWFFNSHPHKEDDCWEITAIYQYLLFNSHPHKEDDGNRIFMWFIALAFQLTSSQGGWLSGQGLVPMLYFFNSHPHKEDDWTFWQDLFLCQLFNSHPHKEDDDK